MNEHALVGKYVQLIYSDFKDGVPITITKFGILVTISGGFATIRFRDGKNETYGNVIKIVETSDHSGSNV